eukprot:Clim_evm57s147 gene=Clim_evmTU57s147
MGGPNVPAEVLKFEREINDMKNDRPPVSKERVALLTSIAGKHMAYYKFIVQYVERFLKKCAPEFKVGVMYVIDALCRAPPSNSIRKKDLQKFAERFERNLKSTFLDSYKAAQSSDQARFKKLLTLWEKGNTFSTAELQEIRAEVGADDGSSGRQSTARDAHHSTRTGALSQQSPNIEEDGGAGKLNITLDGFDYDEDDEDPEQRIAGQKRRIAEAEDRLNDDDDEDFGDIKIPKIGNGSSDEDEHDFWTSDELMAASDMHKELVPLLHEQMQSLGIALPPGAELPTGGIYQYAQPKMKKLRKSVRRLTGPQLMTLVPAIKAAIIEAEKEEERKLQEFESREKAGRSPPQGSYGHGNQPHGSMDSGAPHRGSIDSNGTRESFHRNSGGPPPPPGPPPGVHTGYQRLYADSRSHSGPPPPSTHHNDDPNHMVKVLSTTLHVANISMDFQESEVRDAFSRVGEVLGVTFMPPRAGDNSKRCFVKAASRDGAERMMEKFNGQPLEEGTMPVKIGWGQGFEQKKMRPPEVQYHHPSGTTSIPLPRFRHVNLVDIQNGSVVDLTTMPADMVLPTVDIRRLRP